MKNNKINIDPRINELISKMIRKEIRENKIVNIDQFAKEVASEDEELADFIKTRLEGFDIIENKLNELIPLLKKAKTKTLHFYKENPSFAILFGTDLGIEYLNDLLTLFNDESTNSTGTV